jgi:hypothetical protein
MAASAGTVTLDLDANSVKLLRELQKSERSTRNTTSKMASDFRRLAANAAKTAAAIGTAFAAMSVQMTRSGMKSIDSQAKMARALGASNDALKALQMAAGDAGLEGLDASLNRLNRRLGAAEFGAGAAAVTVKALNLDLQALSEMDIDKRLQSIARTMRNAGISAEQQARHLQNLGFEQATANEFFRTGITDLSQYQEEIRGLGLSLSEIDVRKVEMANDALGVFGDIMQGMSNRLAIAASTSLTIFADHVRDVVLEINKAEGASDEFEFRFRMAIASVVRKTGELIEFLERNKEMMQFGLLGLLVFGRRGALIGGILGSIFTQLRGEVDYTVNSLSRSMAELADKLEAGQLVIDITPPDGDMFDPFLDDAEEFLTRFTSIQEQAAKSMQSAFADFFFDPFKNGLKGMAESFVNVIRRMIAETMALKAIMALAGLGGPIGSFFQMALPSRDSGGRGVPGQPYMIGRGAQPEVFIPDSAGTFIPNADKLGGQSLTINVDARDVGAEARIRDMINREMAPQIIAAARGSTIAAMRRPRFA